MEKVQIWKMVATIATSAAVGGGVGTGVSSQTVGVKIAQLETKVEAMRPYGDRLNKVEKDVVEIKGTVQRIEEKQKTAAADSKEQEVKAEDARERLRSIERKLDVLVDRESRSAP